MCDQVVVKVEFCEGAGEGGEVFDFCDRILAEAEALEGGEAGEFEGGDGGDASVDCVDFGAV